MRRVFISKKVLDLADEYTAKVKLRGFRDKLTKLAEYLETIGKTGHAEYVRWIISDYENILKATPSKYSLAINDNFHISNSIDTGEKIPLPNGDGDERFHKLLVKTMGYDCIRNEIYPKYSKRLGLKTCVYCNEQYGLAIKRGNEKFTSSFQIDHFMPKDKYPWLCTSFFNLQPSCAHCNQLKGNRISAFNLFTEDFSELEPFRFRIDRKSILEYCLTLQEDRISIVLESDDSELLRNHIERFNIDDKYRFHNDEVANLILKARYFNVEYLKQLKNQFGKMFSNTPLHFEEVLLGFPTARNEIHRRPLTLLLQDIAKQLGMLHS